MRKTQCTKALKACLVSLLRPLFTGILRALLSFFFFLVLKYIFLANPHTDEAASLSSGLADELRGWSTAA